MGLTEEQTKIEAESLAVAFNRFDRTGDTKTASAIASEWGIRFSDMRPELRRIHLKAYHDKRERLDNTNTYRVLITGSRRWSNPSLVKFYLSSEYCEAVYRGRRMVVVQGDCPEGPDRTSVIWVEEMIMMGLIVELESHPADWKGKHGKGAGYRRNAEMVKLGAHICHAFIRSESKGATHTADLAAESGIETFIHREG